MTTEIFLGEPPANVKQWIIDHAGHSETRFTLQGGTVETANITGTLDRQWMSNNGYYIPYDVETGEGGYWVKTITQADIGNTVTSISASAFEDCSGLTSITIPDSVTSIGQGAFYNCRGLTNVTIGNCVESIGADAFCYCESFTSVTIGNSVTSIGQHAFYDCNDLTSVTIPDSVTSIGENAFSSCSGLTSVTIVATGKPGASATTVKQAMINAGCPSNITWNMP